MVAGTGWPGLDGLVPPDGPKRVANYDATAAGRDGARCATTPASRGRDATSPRQASTQAGWLSPARPTRPRNHSELTNPSGVLGTRTAGDDCSGGRHVRQTTVRAAGRSSHRRVLRLMLARDGSCRRIRGHSMVAVRCDREWDRRRRRIGYLGSGPVKLRSSSGRPWAVTTAVEHPVELLSGVASGPREQLRE